jgi:hypothetical protein
VTLVTFPGRRFVEQHGICFDQLRRRMALVARDVGVAAGERERRALVVVERGRHPALRIVALPAWSVPGTGLELAAVRFFVTRLTIQGRAFELDLVLSGQRFMALPARHRSVHPRERELCFCVVEAIDINPRSRAVTGFTAKWRAIRPLTDHPVIELAVMGILMAGRAGLVGKPERQNLVCTMSDGRFVTFVTRDGGMGSG